MAIQENIVGLIILLMSLLIILLIILILLACKPWRYFFSPARSRSLVKSDELERLLISDDGGVMVREQSNDLIRNYDIEGACYQNEGLLRSPRTQGLVHKQRLPTTSPHVTQGGSLVLDVISDATEELFVGQTLKNPLVADHLAEIRKHSGQEDLSANSKPTLESEKFQEFVPKAIAYQSCLSLEIVSGPSRGLGFKIQSKNTSRLPLTLGRVSPSDLLLKDSEVSGKHALINWNSNTLKWELVDMGSLNGTLLNSQPINHPDSESRQWGDPIELTSGDVITLGTTSSIYVHITSETESLIPFGVGVASDPMALRRGGKKLPMEDVCYYHWPLPGIDQFGLFGICDGHGGAAAAKFASEMLPKMAAAILSDSLKREMILSQHDASDVLRDAFSQTEESMNYHYEGCTATLLLVWADGDNFFAQCANVGDSACVMSVDGQQIKMTEDHRIVSVSERLRMQEAGKPLKDGETRLCGINLARMLGDKFLKQQDDRFSSEPYISQVVHITRTSEAVAVLASDGFWDVISLKKAIHLAQQTKEKYSADKEISTEKIANFLLSEARTLRTKDNTSIIFLDFDSTIRVPCKVDCK